MEFNFRAFVLARTITITPVCLGEYRKIEKSGSTVFSISRIKSSFRIAQLTEEFLQTRELSEYEPLRQAHILRLVFLFFINRLEHRSRNHRLTDDYSLYFTRYREKVAQYHQGIVALSTEDPRWSLALIAFASNNDDLFRDILRGTAQLEEVIGQLASNPFNFTTSF